MSQLFEAQFQLYWNSKHEWGDFSCSLSKEIIHVFFFRGKWTTFLDWMQLLFEGDDVFISIFFVKAEESATFSCKLLFRSCGFSWRRSFMRARQFLRCRRHFTAHARTHAHHAKRHARTSIFHPLGENSSSREFVKEVCYIAKSTAYDSQGKHWGLDESY